MSDLHSNFNPDNQARSHESGSAFKPFNPVSEIRLRQWYYPLWFSLFALGGGIYLIISPTALFNALSYLLGAWFLLVGLKNLRKASGSQKFGFLTGIFYLGVAGLFFLYPIISLVAIPFMLGTIALLFSLGLFFFGRKIPKQSRFLPRSYKWFAIGAVFLIIAYFAFTEPKGFSAVIGFWIGILLLILAIVGVVLAYFLRRLKLKLRLPG